jgi:glyoxylase-like metal-dependent hydrolase (beta-lactamase superfamily II)
MNRDEIKKLDENISFVPGENRGRFPACHGFLLDGHETVLIDAGIGEDRIRAIDREKRIDVLIITHSHPDHIRCWNLLHDRVIMVPLETPDVVTDLDLLGERFLGSPESGRKWARFVGGFGVSALREPDQRYSDGELLQLGGCDLEAFHAPGHLKDHYCFFERKSGTLITTDIDFTSFGPWYGNPEADIEAFIGDVKKVMALPYTRVCSSHKPPIEGDATDRFEAFLRSFDRQRQAVLELCGRPTTLDDLLAASPFYRNAFPNKEIQRLFETNLVRKNLELLQRDGLIEKSNGRYLRTGH